MTNGQLSSQTINQMYFENRAKTSSQSSNNDPACFISLQNRSISRSGLDIYGLDIDSVKQAVSMSFWLPGDQSIYGIPEREDTLELKMTTGSDPYQMFATDHVHAPNEKGGLYGSIPYIMGLSEDTATSLLWINSARTMVELDKLNDKNGTMVTFSSEANSLEFFMFTNGVKTQRIKTNRVKQANKDLATISGFAPLPLVHTLGYHFCKWNSVSADILMDRNQNFTQYGFPVDVLWSDIEWAQ